VALVRDTVATRVRDTLIREHGIEAAQAEEAIAFWIGAKSESAVVDDLRQRLEFAIAAAEAICREKGKRALPPRTLFERQLTDIRQEASNRLRVSEDIAAEFLQRALERADVRVTKEQWPGDVPAKAEGFWRLLMSKMGK
jgi:hypothetical protein